MNYNSILRSSVFLFSILHLFSMSVNATEYYVATTGNDSNVGTTIAQPWRTVQKAANTLVAGDTAYLRGGTYSEHYITFANSGTSGNVITLKAYAGEIPIVDGGYTTSSGRQPVFFIDNRNYITIDGLTIMRGSVANIYIAYNYHTTNITVKNCEIKDAVTDDNSANIFISAGGADNIYILYNKIHDRILGGSYNNVGDGIKIFRAERLYIRHNEIYNTVDGIYYKHSNDNHMETIVENNIIHDTIKTGILWSRAESIIQNNLIYKTNGSGISIFEESASCDALSSYGNQLLHNTLIDTNVGISLNRSTNCVGAVDTIVKDNLIYNFQNNEMRGLTIYPNYSGSNSSNTTFDHNLIYSAPYPNPIRVLSAYYNTTNVPLTGSGNIQSLQQFRDYANTDFTLIPISPGVKAASDGTNMGANVSAAGPNPAPSPPVGKN